VRWGDMGRAGFRCIGTSSPEQSLQSGTLRGPVAYPAFRPGDGGCKGETGARAYGTVKSAIDPKRTSATRINALRELEQGRPPHRELGGSLT